MEGEAPTMSALAQLQQIWTFDDLQALPEDVDWRRYEIVDGALIVSPAAALRHEVVLAMVRDCLWDAARPEYLVVGSVAVDLDPSYLIPDFAVITDQRAHNDTNLLPATDVLLAGEVVSPGSRTMDRISKAALYAAGGIPVYVRVETQPDVSLTLYELAPGADVYTEVATWRRGEVARLSTPFEVEIPIDSITR
jgi:Uma2 family endonuclease